MVPDIAVIAQVEIVEMEAEKINAIEEMREKMVQATNEAALTVMGMHNELNELEVGLAFGTRPINPRQITRQFPFSAQRCYAASKAETIKWGRVLIATKNCIADKEMLSFRLLDQIQQLYRLLCKRNDAEPAFGRDQVEQQLDYVKGEMEFLADVLQLARRTMASADGEKAGDKVPGKPT